MVNKKLLFVFQNDIIINDLIRKYCSQSVLVIVDVKPKNIGLPTEAYRAVEEIHDDGSPATKTFEHVPSEIGAEEAEEVGVEHLLRDIKDTTVGTLSQKVTNQMMGLKGLHSKLADMKNYVQQVILVTITWATTARVTGALLICISK